MKTVQSAFKFHGGVHPQYNKDLAASKPIEAMPLPKQLVVSMSQHLGAPAKCLVKKGDAVVKGQLIGERNGFISVPVHAPVAGTVAAVEQRMGPAGGWADAVILDVSEDQSAAPAFLPPLDWKSATREDLLARVNDSGICGMGGAGFPSAVKLNPPPDKHCEYLILNGAECEPYLTSDYRTMLERADRIRAGVEIMRKILNGPAVRIAVEANKPDAIKALEKAFADIEGNVEIVVLPVLYPQGSEKHQIYATVKRIVPEGALPIAVGCVVENVGTVAAIADAVEKGIPLTERVTTVSGDGVVEPKNVLAPIGTRYADLVAFCGGEKEGVRFFTSAKVFQYTSNACINCGRCVRACPMQLNPAFICSAVESNDIAAAQKMDVMDCIECGACSFGCPAYRDITQNCRRAKASIRAAAAAAKAKAAAAAAK